MIKLKGGFKTKDPRLDRVPQFDPRSKNFPVAAVLPATNVIPRTWHAGVWLDQGSEGACVGFSWAAELSGSPVRVRDVNDAFARERIYKPAQLIDEWPGEDYEGTSVLAGAKVVKKEGFIQEYRWAFGVDDVLTTLSNYGPMVLGLNWYDSMMEPRPSGLLEVSGTEPSGGHAIMIRGLTLKSRLKGEPQDIPVVRFRNSWGRDWGFNGDCFMKVEDLNRLLQEGGECCVPGGRQYQATLDPRSALEAYEQPD